MYPLVSRVILTGLLIPENISSTILSLRWSGAVGKKVRKKSRLSDSVRGAGDVIITIDSDNHRLFHQSRALKRQVYKGKIWHKSGFIFSKLHRPDKHMENLIIHEKSPVRRTLTPKHGCFSRYIPYPDKRLFRRKSSSLPCLQMFPPKTGCCWLWI